MNYKAHIPGAVALASFTTFVVSAPLSVSFLVGAAIGGVLPDIDQSNSAVNSMASKATDTVSHAVPLPRVIKLLLGALGAVLDALIVRPLGKLWRLFAAGPFFRIYRLISSSAVGRTLRMQQVRTPSDIAGHRGGATHSLNFMVLTSILVLPICIFLNNLPLWMGLEIGIFAHLVADAMCLSGVKFFWPWFPKIGFQRGRSVGNAGGGQKGRDVRIMPQKLQMKTGAESEYASIERGDPDRKLKKHFVRLEVWYRRIFKLLALVFIVLILGGIGPGSGQVLFMGKIIPITNQAAIHAVHAVTDIPSQTSSQAQNTDTTTPVSVDKDGTTSFSDVDEISSQQASTPGVVVPEVLGPTSLTYGDTSADSLPKGVYKLPDESLWIIGVGPVTAENLDKSPYNFSSADKDKMLLAMQNQRTKSNSTANQSQSQGENSTQQEESSGDDSLLGQILSGLFGEGTVTVSGESDGIFGFRGLTPYTQR